VKSGSSSSKDRFLHRFTADVKERSRVLDVCGTAIGRAFVAGLGEELLEEGGADLECGDSLGSGFL
jgi:hypothetical protein